jgi:hypothetical protein
MNQKGRLGASSIEPARAQTQRPPRRRWPPQENLLYIFLNLAAHKEGLTIQSPSTPLKRKERGEKIGENIRKKKPFNWKRRETFFFHEIFFFKSSRGSYIFSALFDNMGELVNPQWSPQRRGKMGGLSGRLIAL